MDRNATAKGTNGLSRYGDIASSRFGLRCHCPRPAGVGGSQPAVRQAGLFVLVSEAYLAAPPTQEMVRLSRARGHSRFGVESATGDDAAGRRRGQAKTGS